MTDDAGRILNRARDEDPDVLDEIVAETRDYSPSQAMERLHTLSEYTRLSGRQRIEAALMTARVETATRALGAYQGGNGAMFDQAHNRPANQVPGQRRQSAPAGRFASQAHRVLDTLHGRGLPDHAAAVADGLMRHPAGAGDQIDSARDLAQRWLTVCGSAEYERAWAAIVRDPVAGGAELDEAERAAWRAGRQIQAALGEAGTGGYMVPVFIDPAIQLSNAGANNPLRQVARVETITTSEWHGITSAGVTAEWSAEAAEAADASPVLASPGVPAYKLDAFVPFSLEMEGDVTSLMAQLATVLTDAANLLAGTTYTTGDGVAKPMGFVPNVTGVDNASGAFVAADVFTTQNALPPRFSANASWLANIAVLNQMGQFETTNGALMFPELRSSAIPSLLHKPVRELSDMTSDMSTTGSQFLAYGSWRDCFLIVDRIGSSIELVPHLMGPNNRPTGQRGAYLWMRTGSAVLVPNAARVLTKTA